MKRPNERRQATRLLFLLLPGLALTVAGAAHGQTPAPRDSPSVVAEEATESEAVSKLRERAGADDVRAQYDLGRALWAARGVARDRAQARAWFERAAATGYPRAQYMAGRSYELGGDGSIVDRDAAESWYRRAAENERLPIPDAAFRLYELHKGLPVWDAFADFEATLDGAEDTDLAARQAEREERRREASEWLALAARLGSTRAYLELGCENESRDPVQALKWAYLAISDLAVYEQGDDRFPMYALFRRLRKALSPQDVLAAKHAVVDWCTEMASGLWRPDQLGTNFAEGLGVVRDPVEAYEWYGVAETIPDALCSRPLEQYAATLTSDELARARALPPLVTARPSRDEDIALGDGPSLETLRTAAENGDRDAAYELGLAYRYGTGTERDFDEAYRWLCFAADERLPEASYALAEMYLAGDIEPSESSAVFDVGPELLRRSAVVRCFQHAGDDGMPRAYARIGQIYEPAGAHDMALTYYSRAFLSGDALGALGLGNLYLGGLGVEQDEVEAAGFYEQAAGEFPQVRNWLILHYFEHRKHPGAYRWLHRNWLDAVRSGDDEARRSAERVFNGSYGAILPDGPAFARSFADPSLTDPILGADVEGWTASAASHVTSRDSIPAPDAQDRDVHPTTIRRTYSNSVSGLEIEIEIEIWKSGNLILVRQLEKDCNWLRENVGEHVSASPVDVLGGHVGFLILDTAADTATVLVRLNGDTVLSITTGKNGSLSHFMALLLVGMELELDGLAGALEDHRIE